MQIESKYNAIVLPGGGIKGFAVLGSIQYMIDQKLINIDHINFFSGTSIGAIICYFLAIGYTPIEMIVYIITHKVFKLGEIKSIDSILNGNGVYDYSIIKNHLETMTLEKIGYIPTLKELYEHMDKTLYTCTFNVTKKIVEYLSYHNYPDMLCIEALQLSSSLPFIFNDSFYNNDYYIDGGIVDNFPYNVIKDERIISIYFKEKEVLEYSKIIDKFYTIMYIPMNELTKKSMEMINTENIKIIMIEVEHIKIYDFNSDHSKQLELFSTGYSLTKDFFKNNKSF